MSCFFKAAPKLIIIIIFFYLYSAFPTPKVTLQVRLKEQRQKDINTRRHNIPRDEINIQKLTRLD